MLFWFMSVVGWSANCAHPQSGVPTDNTTMIHTINTHKSEKYMHTNMDTQLDTCFLVTPHHAAIAVFTRDDQ